jgi:hypothetical protein
MPASVGGEWGRSAELVSCPECGAPTSRGDRYCRSCGAEQGAAGEPTGETEQLSGAAAEADIEPPTERATRAEPPTERRPPPQPPRLEAPPPPPAAPRPQPRNARRRLIALAVAVAIGLLAGLAAVALLNGRDKADGTGASQGGGPATTLDPVETLRAHFDLLEQGRFLTASDDLTPELLDSLGGRAFWVSERIADLLLDAQLDASVAEETDSTATVRVDSLRTDSLTSGCTDFSGTYSMVRSGDRWLIDSADLIDRPC